MLLLSQTITFARPTKINNITVLYEKSKASIVLDFSFEAEDIKLKRLGSSYTAVIIKNSKLLSCVKDRIFISENNTAFITQDESNLKILLNVPYSSIELRSESNPNKTIIDLNGFYSNPLKGNINILKPTYSRIISEAVVLKRCYLPGPVKVSILDIDLNNPAAELIPLTASKKTILSKNSLNNILNNNNAIAGINASFFKPPTGLPLGTLIINGEFLTGPILNRVALVIDDYNRAYMDQIKFKGSLKLGNNTTLNFQNINQPRLSKEDYMLYTDKWYYKVPKTLKNELHIAVLNNKVINKTTDSLYVPQNGYVITGPNRDQLSTINIGETVELKINKISEIDNIKHAIGGGPYLIKNGEIYVDYTNQNFRISPNTRDPRTAVAITRDNHLLLVTVDGRQKASIGMSFYQLAQFLKKIGAYQAINFDGGGSTQMVINGSYANNPCEYRSISTSIGVKIKNTTSIANKTTD